LLVDVLDLLRAKVLIGQRQNLPDMPMDSA
jgi:hypothetical protein